MATRKEARAVPKPKKVFLEDEEVPEEYDYDYSEGYFYEGIYHGPEKPVRFNWRLPYRKILIPTDTPKTVARANAKAKAKGNAEDEVDEEPKEPFFKYDAELMKLLKRMNKSPSSEVSKERTRMLKESRQEAQSYHQIVD